MIKKRHASDPPKIFNRTPIKPRRQELRKSMTSAEIVLWNKLRSKQLSGLKFRRQFSIMNYIVDFYCPEAKLAVEIDGESHFIPGAQKKDSIRQQLIEKHGVKILRFTNRDVLRNIEGVWLTIFATIEKVCKKDGDGSRKPPLAPP
jgi:very-short-patch-repair endonuclease